MRWRSMRYYVQNTEQIDTFQVYQEVLAATSNGPINTNP